MLNPCLQAFIKSNASTVTITDEKDPKLREVTVVTPEEANIKRKEKFQLCPPSELHRWDFAKAKKSVGEYQLGKRRSPSWGSLIQPSIDSNFC
jgi:hypothetical protein